MLLLSSTRYDRFLLTLRWNSLNGQPSPFLLLHYHYHRLLDAANTHGWSIVSQFTYQSLRKKCQDAVDDYSATQDEPPRALKIRITLSESAELLVTASPATPFASDPTDASFFSPTDSPSRFAPIRTIAVDTEPTPSSIFTITKTTERDMYNNARTRVGILPLSATGIGSIDNFDVLLYNSDGSVTETSICNVAFFRGPPSRLRWVTPQASTGCLPGVMRRWLLEQGRIREATPADELTKDSIQPGEWVLVFNSVQGCKLGRIAG